jgi:hypothetical protein
MLLPKDVIALKEIKREYTDAQILDSGSGCILYRQLQNHWSTTSSLVVGATLGS